MSARVLLITNEEIKETCCLCCNIRDGAVVTAVVTMAIKFVQLVAAAVLLQKYNVEDKDGHTLYIADVKLGALICDALLLILFSIMLLIALGKIWQPLERDLKYKCLYYPWMIYVMLNIGFTLGGSILFFIYKSNLEASLAIVGFILYSYLFFSVLRYYKLLYTAETVNCTLETLKEIVEINEIEENQNVRDEPISIQKSELK